MYRLHYIMKKIGYILILLPFMIAATAQAQSAKQFFKAGEDFAKANNYSDAIIQFTKAHVLFDI